MRMRKTDDRGFTLVELLVSVTILAIIIVPLLYTFVSVTKTNTKSKNKLSASMAGQNLFEELKAADVDTFMAGATNIPVLDASGNRVQDAKGNDIFILEKEFDRSADGKDYHMILRLDPTDYTTLAGEAEKATDYNSLDYANLTSLSNAGSAFLFVNTSDVTDAVNELLLVEPLSASPGMIATEDQRREEIAARLTREITITITKTASSGSTIVHSTITYKDGTYTYTTRDEEIYNNGTNLGNVLSNIFICFYPMYNNTARSVPTESITIDNSENQEVGVYLIKQTDETTDTSAADAKYSVDVKVLGTGSNPETTVVTNMAYTEGQANNQMLLSYTGGTLPVGKTLTEALHVSAGDAGLQNAGAGTRIYNVSIEVYRKKNGGGAVTYEEKDLLTTLDGTKME
jgi:prepilin-type N-terminal cleavage/methylation domain-containing protein